MGTAPTAPSVTTPIGHSLIAAALISLVLVEVLGRTQSGALAPPLTTGAAVAVVPDEIDPIEAVAFTGSVQEVIELKAQMAALVGRIESLEVEIAGAGLKGPAVVKAEALPPTAAEPSRVAVSAIRKATPEAPSALEARWVVQATDTNWEARVESQLVDLVSESQSLGLGAIDLGAADCRGDLCKLNVTSGMHPSMVQHLLTQFVGNTRIVVDRALGPQGFMAFVQQRP